MVKQKGMISWLQFVVALAMKEAVPVMYKKKVYKEEWLYCFKNPGQLPNSCVSGMWNLVSLPFLLYIFGSDG